MTRIETDLAPLGKANKINEGLELPGENTISVPYPTVYEVYQAKEIFSYFVNYYASHGNMSRSEVISNALCQVWTAARVFQQAKDATPNYKEYIALYKSIVRGGDGIR